MRVLLINQFFPPDLAPTGQVLRDLAVTLRSRGHAVTMLCSSASYVQQTSPSVGADEAGLNVVRLGRAGVAPRSLSGKALRYVAFWCRTYARVTRLASDSDLILTMTTPPWIGLAAKWGSRGRCGRVNWIMDLYPDVLFAQGWCRPSSFVGRTLRALTRAEWDGAALMVTPGMAMSAHVCATAARRSLPRVAAVPLWAPASVLPWPVETPNPLRKARGWADDECVFLYAGNMGRGHRVDVFLDAARQLSGERRIRWVFAGGGPRRTEVERFRRENPGVPVECLGHVAAADLAAHLGSGDVHLMSLRSDWVDLILPSKLQAAFAAGRPAILVGPPTCEPATWIRESGGGWCVGELDAAGLEAAVKEALSPVERRKRGDNAWRYSRAHFDRRTNCEKICGLIEAVQAERMARAGGGPAPAGAPLKNP